MKNTILEVSEHTSPHYSPRTWHNAKSADLTVALALDFNTAGERLTKKASDPNYLAIGLGVDPHEAARLILLELQRRQINRPVINIAGNGIYSLEDNGWSQQRVNIYLYDIIDEVAKNIQIAKIISGGQTGVDLAGIIAAHALGIPATATLPNGFIQRNAAGQDLTHTMKEIVAMIESGAKEITAESPIMDPKPLFKLRRH